MEQRLFIAGFGGQGVLLIGQLLAYAGMHEGHEVTWMPSYGPAMRGGSANCSVVISDEPIGSPLVSQADVAIIMNRPSFDKFESIVAPGGTLIYNTSLIDRHPSRDDITNIPVPCNEVAAELGNARVANMVVMGAYLKNCGKVSRESIVHALKEVLGPSKEHLLPVNESAISWAFEN